MRMYKWIRDKIDFVTLDFILYDNSKQSELKTIYYKRFDETIKRVGDSKLDMTKTMSTTEFFDDNVNLYINHDDLHKKIALMCRNTETLLFKQLQIGDSVELS